MCVLKNLADNLIMHGDNMSLFQEGEREREREREKEK